MEVSEAMQTEFSVSDSDSGQSRRTAAKFRTTGSADAVVSLTRDFQSKATSKVRQWRDFGFVRLPFWLQMVCRVPFLFNGSGLFLNLEGFGIEVNFCRQGKPLNPTS